MNTSYPLASVVVTDASCDRVVGIMMSIVALTNLHRSLHGYLVVLLCWTKLCWKQLVFLCWSGLKTVLLTLSAIGHARTSFCEKITTSSSFALHVRSFNLGLFLSILIWLIFCSGCLSDFSINDKNFSMLCWVICDLVSRIARPPAIWIVIKLAHCR